MCKKKQNEDKDDNITILCPVCGKVIESYIEGPSGGLSLNIWVTCCGSRLNMFNYYGPPRSLEVLIRYERPEIIDHKEA